jgi:hypothetical protein
MIADGSAGLFGAFIRSFRYFHPDTEIGIVTDKILNRFDIANIASQSDYFAYFESKSE